MKTLKLFLSACLILSTTIFCSGTGTHFFDDDTVTKELNDITFNRINLGSFFKVKFIQSDSYKVKIELPEEFVPYLVSEVKGDELILYLNYKNLSVNRLKFHDTAEAVIYAPTIEAINLKGASKLTLEGKWQLDEAAFKISGASKFICEQVQARHLSIDQSGASATEAKVFAENLEIRTAGTCKMTLTAIGDQVGSNMEVKVYGASKVDLSELPFEQIILDVEGASKLLVKPLKQLHANAAGASKVLYDYSSKELQREFKTMGVATIKPM